MVQIVMFKNPFSFKGRIGRTEYCISFIISGIYIVMIGIIGWAITEEGAAFNIFCVIGCIPLYWFFLAQGAKRCHDGNNPGWYQLIPFYQLLMVFGSSDPGINKYGPNPK